ncbi:MAG: leucine-rich repeat domain-containing protein, partial [Clostridiales bacterium]|nr:leucine-rich repeat domain-containing protein [Clostridiales bacterium]
MKNRYRKAALAIALALAVVATQCVPPMAVSYADTITDDDGFTYSTNGTEATITGYSGEAAEIEIPSEITYDGSTYTVTAIGQQAFQNCTSLETVTFEEGSGLTSIGI